VVRAVAAPDFAVQLRDRTERSDDSLFALASELRSVSAHFVVNRRLALARRVGADGFHAPAGELGGARDFAWRSAPAHSDEDVPLARHAGATAVFVSPIFDTPNKGAARGVAALARARALLPRAVRVIALGGIDATNASACYEAGADDVAVMRALLDAPDPAAIAKCLVRSRA
jgi:thiamine-phosphate pyrophosphorylase